MLHTYFEYLQHAIAIANWQYELAIMIEHKADDDDDDDGSDWLTIVATLLRDVNDTQLHSHRYLMILNYIYCYFKILY